MKKIIGLFLVLAMITSVFVACGKSEDAVEGGMETTNEKDVENTSSDDKKAEIKVREPLKFQVVLRDAEVSPADVELYRELESKTGTQIEWITATEAGWEEKRALLFASNTLPDAFFGTMVLEDDDVLKYGAQGMLIPLEDYITPELMPYFSAIVEAHPEYLKAITAPDGHIYSLPAFDDGIVTTTKEPLYINQDWLNAVNMTVPTTLDEYYEVLKVFKENDVNGNGDPDDEIPLVFMQQISDMFGAFGVVDNYQTHIDVADGQVYYTATTSEYKEAIKYFNKLFKEGLIDPEAFTQDRKAFKAKLKSEERVAGSFQTWRSSGWAIKEEDASYVPVPPMAGPDGTRMWPEMINGVVSKGAFAITSEADDPAFIMSWIDNVYEPEFAVQASFALKIGIHLEYGASGALETVEVATTENRKGQVPMGRERIFNMTEVTAELLAEAPKHMIEKQMLDTYYNDFYKDEYYPMVFFTLEETEELSILKTDIISYTNEMYAKWIAVGGIEEEWDAYIDQLNKMGLTRMIEIHQAALDRYNG